jgi:predicted dehydrogenase
VSAATKYGIVGDGWRAQFFHEIAATLPDQLQIVGVVVRSEATAERVRQRWGVATYSSVDELISAQSPDVVLASTPSDVNAQVMRDCIARRVPVLAETPPARDLDALRRVWDDVGSARLVQVAEQYLLMPMHAARVRLVEQGTIGLPGSVQVSSTHQYHAVSMIRGLLRPTIGAGFGPTTVSAQAFTAPLIDPLGQKGWTGNDEPRAIETTIATIDFGDAMGLYDFTDNQWHNQLRSRRIVVRGSAGEISNEEVVTMPQPRTFLTSPIVRRQIGYDLDLDGYDTDHISFEGDILWRNPYPGARFSDEEIAIATIMLATAAWARDEAPAPYPLADACQDELITTAIEESVATGNRVSTTVEAWAAEEVA